MATGCLVRAAHPTSRRNGWDSRLTSYLLQRLGDQEGQFQRLVGVHPRVAVGVVAVRQAVLGDRSGAADAFGDVLPGHLDMDAAGVAALGLVHREELPPFREDLREVAGL